MGQVGEKCAAGDEYEYRPLRHLHPEDVEALGHWEPRLLNCE